MSDVTLYVRDSVLHPDGYRRATVEDIKSVLIELGAKPVAIGGVFSRSLYVVDDPDDADGWVLWEVGVSNE